MVATVRGPRSQRSVGASAPAGVAGNAIAHTKVATMTMRRANKSAADITVSDTKGQKCDCAPPE